MKNEPLLPIKASLMTYKQTPTTTNLMTSIFNNTTATPQLVLPRRQRTSEQTNLLQYVYHYKYPQNQISYPSHLISPVRINFFMEVSNQMKHIKRKQKKI